jgi:hypothetical protein
MPWSELKGKRRVENYLNSRDGLILVNQKIENLWTDAK